MLKLKRKAFPQAGIPDASMADIAFLLIIFFLVTRSFSVDKVAVALPSAQDRVRVEIPTKGSINISITASGEVRVEGLVATMLDVQNIAEGAVARDADKFFVLRADRHVPYRYVDEVLERLRLVKVKNISLETRSGGGGFGP